MMRTVTSLPQSPLTPHPSCAYDLTIGKKPNTKHPSFSINKDKIEGLKTSRFSGNHIIHATINVLNPLFVIQNVAFSCCLSRPSSSLHSSKPVSLLRHAKVRDLV